MQISLLPLDPPPCLRYFIRADGRHAGGITVHSVQGAQFSYGVAVSGNMRRRGVASSALMLLFETMKSRGLPPASCKLRRTTPLRWRCTENWALFKPGGMHRP